VVSVGQVLAVAVLRAVTEQAAKRHKKDKAVTKRRIQVSFAPSSVNLLYEEPTPKFPIRGSVQSIEDNGLLIDLGHGRKGFLSFDDIDDNMYKVNYSEDGDDDDEEEEDNEDGSDGASGDGRIVLRVGRISDFVVQKASTSTTGIVTLSLPSPDRMARSVISSDAMPSIQAISPGWLVKVKVEAVARNGLCVAFFGNAFRGAIELSHVGGYWIPKTRQHDGSTDWKSLFRDDGPSTIRSFTARILAADAATKTIRLTVLPHLMDMRSPPSTFLPPTGTVIENATVIKVDPGVGALLALPPKILSKGEEEMEIDKLSDAEEEEDYDDEVNRRGYEETKEENSDDEDDAAAARSFLHQPLSDRLAYKQASKVRAVYVHISKAMDEREDGRIPEESFAKAFAPSTTHSVRILR